ncbi:RNA polymerase subunit sigma-70 [Terrimonas sp.]|uniref:RNA polymerase sigma factor n=1 Tax=Terrimonas sp. TaxID=1914338 RepID=UPI000D51F198|nr:sigma-70 family RNA polymerase sigma factor [Terrimonas sp.]PVD54006.1 RNA polymerase subunit sigma-70 [Terrimonas sp.]
MQEDIFISVVETHKGILYKIANAYCKSMEDREDLIQEMIFQLWRSFENYNAAYQYSTWIYRIALNVAISFYRKNKQSSFVLPLEEHILNIREPEPGFYNNDKLRLLNTFIGELKDLDKALMLLYLEEKSYKEIAEIIGISETNVGTKIGRIKQLLKQKFNANHE